VNHPDKPEDPLLASARQILTSASSTFEVKPWREIMATKNVAATTKAKEVKDAAKKVATTKVAPYKHQSTGQDVTNTGAVAEGMAKAGSLAERGLTTVEGTDTGRFVHSRSGVDRRQSEGGVDSPGSGVVYSGSDHQPAHQENPMSKQTPKTTEGTTTEAAANPTSTKQEADAAAAKAKIAAKEAKAKEKADRDAKAAATAAEKAKLKAEKDAKAAENKAAREAKAAELAAAGRKYTGSMLALSERVKAGIYVKSTTGQLRSTDAIAEAFDAVPPQNVVKLGTLLFGEQNKYAALNIGQQSMNYRNRLRGAVRAGAEVNGVKITIELIAAKIAELGLDTGKAEAEARAKAKAEREQKAADTKKAKEEAKAKAEAAAAEKKAAADKAAKEAGQKKAADASQAQAAV
jgi:hypothetical protein